MGKEAKRLKLELPGSGENANTAGEGDEEDLPPMWEKVPSESRPGDFSYRHKETQRKVRKRPTVNTPSRKSLNVPAVAAAAASEGKDEVQVSAAQMNVTVLEEEEKEEVPPEKGVAVVEKDKKEVSPQKDVTLVKEDKKEVSPQKDMTVLKGDDKKEIKDEEEEEDSSQVITSSPQVIQPLNVAATNDQPEILSYGEGSFTRIINGGRRYPIGFHSKMMSSKDKVWYECRVLADKFTVDCANVHYEAETCNTVWEKVYASIGSTNRSGFEMFGFADHNVQLKIRSMEQEWVEPVPFSAVDAIQNLPSMWNMRNEILRIVHANQPQAQDQAAAVKVIERLVTFKTLTWTSNASTAKWKTMQGDGEQVQVFFPAKIHLYTANDVVSFCGLLSPENALTAVIAQVKQKNPCTLKTYYNVIWNNVLDVQLVSTPLVNMSTPFFPCRVLTTRLRLPYTRKSLQGAVSQHTFDLDCSWTMHRNSFQVSMQSNTNNRVVLSESAERCHEALSLALVNPLLVRELISTASVLPSVLGKRCQWVLASESDESIEFAKRDNKIYVKSVSFLLKNAMKAPRIGDLVIMVSDDSAYYFREVDDVMACKQVSAVVFTRINVVGLREQPIRPTTLFPNVVEAITKDPVVGNILFGFTLSMIWYLEAHGGLPVLQDDTKTKRFIFNAPYYIFNYRLSVNNMHKALRLDLTSNILVCDELAAQDMEYTKMEEHCKMMALLDKESAAVLAQEVVDEPPSRAKLFPYVSCDALFKAGGKDVVIQGGDTSVVLSGYQCKMLSGLPDPISALNGVYVLREEEENDEGKDEHEAGDKLERWVFVGGKHELSRAFAGMVAMSRFPIKGSKSAEHCWILARFPLNVDESILLFSTQSGEWLVPQEGKWVKSNQVKFVSMEV